MNLDLSLLLGQMGFVNVLTDQTIWGFMWQNEQSDDRVTFINDLPAIYTQDYAPAGSKRAAYLNKIRPVEVNPATNVVNKLADNVTLLADGVTPSNVTNPDWLQFSVLPRIYFRYKYLNGYHVVLFSETYKPYFTLYDTRLRARYRGTTGSGKLLSYANNQNPTVKRSLITNQSQARATASWLDVNDYYTYFLQTMLMTADCGRFNHQYYWVGASAASMAFAASIPCGRTNAMTTANGNGTAYSVSASNVTPFRWRFIENPYGGIWDELIGLYAVHAENEVKQRAFATMNRNLFTTNNDYSQYTLLGEINRMDGWVKEWLGGTILPSAIGGSSTLYKCDYNYNGTWTAAFINTVVSGGASGDGSNVGSFYLNLSWSALYAHVAAGASLTSTELPEIIKNQL